MAAPGSTASPRTSTSLRRTSRPAGAHYIALDFIAAEAANGDIRVMAEQVKTRDRLGLQERIKLRRRPEPYVSVRAIVGRASLGRRAGHRLAEGFRACPPIRQGRLSSQRHVRHEAGAAFGACANTAKFNDAMEESMSTIRHLERLRAPITVIYGTNETPEFQRQSREFAAAVKAAGKPVTLIVARTASL
jgi:arylformamidase